MQELPAWELPLARIHGVPAALLSHSSRKIRLRQLIALRSFYNT
jgi:hypothetical protein